MGEPRTSLVSLHRLRHLNGSFTAPNSDNPYTAFVDAINYAKWRMYDFPQMQLAELRNNPAASWKVGEPYYG
jgi:hypothetical protein